MHKVLVQAHPDASADQYGILGDRLIDAQLNDIEVQGYKKVGVYLRNSHHNIVTGLKAPETETAYFEGENCKLNIGLLS